MHLKRMGLVLVLSGRVAMAHELTFQLPVDPEKLTEQCRRFGTRITNSAGELVGHAGQDYCANRGTPVKAAGIGAVVFARTGNNHGLGYSVIISHSLDNTRSTGNDVFTLYAHLDSIVVQEGQWVAPGEKIGTVGQTGSGSKFIDHLHFEVKSAGLLEAPDPNGLSQDNEYGYTARPPDQMGYINPALFLLSPEWRSIHLHGADGTPRSGRHYVEGRFDDAGQVKLSTIVLDNATWTTSRIDFDVFQGGVSREGMSSPLPLILIPGDGSRIGDISFPFQDVAPGQWYAGYATRGWARNVVSGESGLLAPMRNASFSEFLKMLIEASPHLEPIPCSEGERPVPTFSLTEFPAFTAGNPWYCSYYKAAAQVGWMNDLLSVAGQRGRPTQKIQRQEAAFFLAMALPLANDLKEVGFTDVQETNPYYGAIRKCSARGIFRGYQDGSFGMGQEIIRAEIVKILAEAFYPEAAAN